VKPETDSRDCLETAILASRRRDAAIVRYLLGAH
jgi:hypothetical protein